MARPPLSAAPPPGFHVGDDDITTRPKVVVRTVQNQFGGSRTIDLVAVEKAKPGDVLVKEPLLLEWNEEHAFPVPQKTAGEVEMLLAQRCAAIKKMSGQMQQVRRHCDTLLPIIHAQCHKKHVAKGDADSVWTLPWEMKDTLCDPEELKTKAAFCVLAHRGFSNTVLEKSFKDHMDVSRLVVMAERGALPTPRGKGLCKYTSAAEPMAYVKPRLVSVGSRPTTKKSKAPEVPTPNADYSVDPATGIVTLVAKKHIAYGDHITIPKEKQFEKVDSADVMSVLKDKSKMEAALLHQAKDASASSDVKSYAKMRHPTVPNSLPPPGSVQQIAKRDVRGELWHEVVIGDMAVPEKPLAYSIDYCFDERECVALVGALSRSGTTAAFPYHVGFDMSTRVVNPQDFSQIASHLFARVAGRIPTTVHGKRLVGVANQGMFLHLRPGEELLEFDMHPTKPDAAAHTVPFALMFSSNGALTLEKSKHRIDFKAGRMVSWPSKYTHRLPVCLKGDMIVLFSYLMYSNAGPQRPSQQMA